MKISVVNQSKHPLPQYETSQSAGMDVRANLESPVVLAPLQRALIKTGLFIALPAGFEVQVRPRSGLAYKKGITVLNSPGTIDADYRGELKVILINLGEKTFIIEKGLRIAQMVLCPVIKANLKEVNELEKTERGTGGFGSTGTK
jgi:dUTP pyrophosphatase